MRINLLGPSGNSICEVLDAAGIEYEYREFRPVPKKIYNASFGDWLEIADEGAPWAAIATVLVAWIRGRANRAVMIKTGDHKVIRIHGMSAADVERVIQIAEQINALDVEEPKVPKNPKLRR